MNKLALEKMEKTRINYKKEVEIKTFDTMPTIKKVRRLRGFICNTLFGGVGSVGMAPSIGNHVVTTAALITLLGTHWILL